MNRIVSILFAGAVAAVPIAQAGAPEARAPAQPAATKAAPMTPGEIVKVDREGGKITIKHGAIVNLDMPPMTMAFGVKDQALLAKVKPGDRIRFVAESTPAGFTVVALETVK